MKSSAASLGKARAQDAGATVLRPDVSLAPLSLSYANRMYRWMKDPEVAGNIGLRASPSLSKTRDWISKAANDSSIRAFAIMVGKRHVGNVVLDKIDRYLSTTRLSIYIGDESYRGGGVGRTAVYHALRFSFEELKLYKVWLTVHSLNARAIASYLRMGFQLEGVLRGEFLLGNKRLSAWYMSVLTDEFKKWTES